VSYVTQPRKAVGCASLPAFMPPGERACVESLAFAFRVLFFPTVFSEMVTGRNLRTMMPGFRVGQWRRRHRAGLRSTRSRVARWTYWADLEPITLRAPRTVSTCISLASSAPDRTRRTSPSACRVRKWHRRAPHQDGPGGRPAGMARNHAIDDKLRCSRGCKGKRIRWLVLQELASPAVGHFSDLARCPR